MKRYHFIAIGGSAMNSLAIALKEQGNQISGSDDAILVFVPFPLWSSLFLFISSPLFFSLHRGFRCVILTETKITITEETNTQTGRKTDRRIGVMMQRSSFAAGSILSSACSRFSISS